VKKLSIVSAALALAVAWPLQAATRTAAFEVSGWTCGSCAAATRIALKKLDGVEDVKTDLDRNEALVTYEDSKITTDRMAQAIARLGYKATLKKGAPASGSQRPETSALPVAARETPPSERLSFFEVPLECGAAEGLGCGSAAKPILSELDRSPGITEARINHPGTTLVVVWKAPRVQSDAAVEALFEKRHLAAAVLKGQAREKALKEFQSEEWYGAAEVDRLSEHEARVIAARIVHRAGARLGLPPNRLAALTEDLAVVFARHMTRRDEECDTGRDVVEAELARAASKYLGPQQLVELRKAGEQGIHALPGEDK